MRQGKLVTWSWDWLQSLPDQSQCYQLTTKQIVFLLSAFRQAEWSTRWHDQPADFDDILSWVADTQAALLSPRECDTNQPTNPSIDNSLDTLSLADCLIEELEDDDQMSIQIQKVNGVPYLVEVCCGGLTTYYQLTSVGVNPETGAPIDAGDGGTLGSDPAWDWGNVDENNADCYATNATDYLLDRAIEWAHLVIDAAVLGDEIFEVLPSELYNIPLMIANIAFGTDYPTLQDLTKNAVSTALNDSAYRTELAGNWTFTGSVTRNELRSWINSAAYLVGGVPARLILNLWLDNSLILGYNNKLSQIAVGCEVGGTGGVPGATWFHDFNWVTNNTAQGWVAADGDEILGTLGWETVDGNTDHNIALNYAINGTVSGNFLAVRFYLDAPLQGTPAGLFRWRVVGQTSAESPNSNAQEYLLIGASQSFDNTDTFQLTITTQNVGEQLLQKLQRAIIYGNGDNPFA